MSHKIILKFIIFFSQVSFYRLCYVYIFSVQFNEVFKHGSLIYVWNKTNNFGAEIHDFKSGDVTRIKDWAKRGKTLQGFMQKEKSKFVLKCGYAGLPHESAPEQKRNKQSQPYCSISLHSKLYTACFGLSNTFTPVLQQCLSCLVICFLTCMVQSNRRTEFKQFYFIVVTLE